jgi:hypothetical protein
VKANSNAADPAITARTTLAADLARILADAPGLPGETLARRVRRRRTDVLATLQADARFVRTGDRRGSRWHLAEEMPPSAHGTDFDGLKGTVAVSVKPPSRAGAPAP